MKTLSIADQDGPLEIGFEDLKKFHGTRSICGLTVGFTILSAAWPHLSAGQPLARDTIEIETGFPGPGARDAFEMVTRAVSRDAYHVRTGINPTPKIAEAAKGAYWFRVSSGDKAVELGLKPEVVPSEFVARRRRILAGDADAREAAAFRSLQREFSTRLLIMDPAEAVNRLDDGNDQ